MNTHRSLRALALAAALVAATSAGSFGQEREQRINHSFDVGGNGELSLSNISGDIVVSATNGGTIEVEAVKRLRGNADPEMFDYVEVEVSHNGDRVRVETRYLEDGWNRRGGRKRGGVTVDYRVTVPTGTEVELVSVSGDVELDGVEGESSVQSVSGDVRVTDSPAATEVKSVSGDVHVRGIRSGDNLEVASVSGEVTLEDIEAEELDVESVSGDVTVTDVVCDEAELDSTSGDLRYSGAIRPSGSYEFRSHSGDVEIELDGDVGFQLEARTHSGRIESDFEMQITEQSRRRKKISAIIGDGSAVIETRTFSGDVVLSRR